MNSKLSYAMDLPLLDQMAEKLLKKGYSISYQRIQEIEVLSASLQDAVELNSVFIAFDPVETNDAVFLALLYFLEEVDEYIHIVVPSEYEREFLLNILEMKEIKRINDTCLSEISHYPLQVLSEHPFSKYKSPKFKKK